MVVCCSFLAFVRKLYLRRNVHNLVLPVVIDLSYNLLIKCRTQFVDFFSTFVFVCKYSPWYIMSIMFSQALLLRKSLLLEVSERELIINKVQKN